MRRPASGSWKRSTTSCGRWPTASSAARGPDPPSAEARFRRALAIGVEALAPGHPLLADVRLNLAQLLAESTRPHEAQPLLHDALAARESTFGLTSPQVAFVLARLVALELDLGATGEARRHLQRARQIARRVTAAGGHLAPAVEESLARSGAILDGARSAS